MNINAQTIVPSENWDDDFEFSQSHERTQHNLKPSKTRQTGESTVAGASTKPAQGQGIEPRLSVTSSHFSEDWDADDGSGPSRVQHHAGGGDVSGGGVLGGGSGGVRSQLSSWAESGPSTPTKRSGAQAENWDADYEDKADSPPSRRIVHHPLQHHAHALRTRHSYHTPPRPKLPPEPENWDEDFDDPMDSHHTASTNRHGKPETDNDNTPMTKRTRQVAYTDASSDDEDAEFGFSEEKEEDKTVTARSRSALMLRASSSQSSHPSPPPPVPSLPHGLALLTSSSPIEPFPRSPTVSVFSIPTTSGRNSVGYTSTSHLALTGGSTGKAGSLAMLPPSPPIHRERRRLRKKSRPPHLDNNVFELVEEQRDSVSPPPQLPPSTPERERASSPLVGMSGGGGGVGEATPGSGATKTPLLSRIGSVKKWGVRRKRASTGPAEVMMHEFGGGGGGGMEEDSTPRPPSSLAHGHTHAQSPTSHGSGNTNTRSNWFFRPGGAPPGSGSPPPGHAAELKHEKSLDKVRLRSAVPEPTTPSKTGGKLSRRNPSRMFFEASSSGEFTGEGGGSSGSVLGLGKPSLSAARRPTSMQVPNGVGASSGSGGSGSGKFPSAGTRHASYGSSVGRASSSRVFSTPTPTESVDELDHIPPVPTPQEGSRSFMGSVRKISLVGVKKHKKKKSSAEIIPLPPVPTTPSFPDRSRHRGRAAEESGGGEGDGDGDVLMAGPGLLPPIELQPPSPPRTINGMSASHSAPINISDGIESLLIPSSSAPVSVSLSPRSIAGSGSAAVANRASPKTPSSPQSASLGRATQAPNPPPSNASNVPRRNSLGDLKIPARISQAQIGLKRDLGMVRDFAASVDRLKELQSTYHHLISEVHTILESAPPSRATSPTIIALARPRSRLRSNTAPPTNPNSNNPTSFSEHKHLAASLHAIVSKYKISWECAELLIELGGGTPSPASPPPPSSSVSAPSMSVQAEIERGKNRERAVTLSGEESKPPPVPFVGVGAGGSGGGTGTAMGIGTSTSGPPNASWRASTGRHDLSQRQLVLLRDMLNSGEVLPDDVPIPEDSAMVGVGTGAVNRNWRWGDAMSSTVTLPSEESGSRTGDAEAGAKKRRGKLGMSGLRDMLRMLKRSHSEQAPPLPPPPTSLPIVPASTASLSTESSIGSQSHHQLHHYPHAQVGARRGSKTSTGPESVRSTREVTNSPYGGPPLNHKASPRRPSLASIFRIGQKNKGGTGASSSAGESSQGSRSDVRSASRGSNMTGEEEDWDRIDSVIDLDSAARALGIEGSATIKGRKGRGSPFLSDHPLPHVHGPGYGARPVTPQRGPDAIQALRIEVEASPRSIRPMRSTRLSNVEEVEDAEREPRSKSKAKNRASLPRTSPHRPPSRGQLMSGNGKTGSVRSAPPQSFDGDALPDIKLSMTPENIKPLLENAKEVHLRLNECIKELRVLLDAVPTPASAPS
ncbi:hypothetical protein HYDPIDRAFT_169152 [Hydnomerulius pinastri MD-312]|uniref:Uncharacterized protein n=1 Tax=Hydnomerulius pinastri MD-312 TaxID=994086 RepID=A0A0C9WCW5_9AGAM|nr:hypothetical protein HYDPIDRAFT_169152 [Hydnomerulius pinastri MD-312]